MMHCREEGRIYWLFSCFVFTRVEKRRGVRGEKEGDEKDEGEMN